jgi:thiamine biosynthesis protein ThiI
MNSVVVHYSEIGLKGDNRPFFERHLVKNIKIAIRNTNYESVKRSYGNIIIRLRKDADNNVIIQRLAKIPGIKWYALAEEVKQDIKIIKREALKLSESSKRKTFKVNTRRSDKSFSLTSMEVDAAVGEAIRKKTSMKVKLKHSGFTLHIEICSGSAYLFTHKLKGIGGLPVDSAGTVLSLLSGGIDSPVASYLMMKRGCRIIFIHFMNEAMQPSEDKITSLVKKLNDFQQQSRLYIVKFSKVQRAIIKQVPAKQRMIVYRITMFNIAVKVMEKENAKAFVTGDSIAQVASQTLDNLRVIYYGLNYPVFSPCIGMNKQEIMDLAIRIGTYDVSIQPYADCCSYLIDRHPETKANVDDIKDIKIPQPEIYSMTL